MYDREIERIELRALGEAVLGRYGLDLRGFGRPTARRRLWQAARAEGATTLSGLQERLLHDPAAWERLLERLVTRDLGLFRDPTTLRLLGRDVLPRLRTYPSANLWCAGCSGGEEVHTIAILLEEAGLLGRCRILATEASERCLRRARTWRVARSMLEDSLARYDAAGGQRVLRDHYEPDGTGYALRPALRRQVFFAQHNLATDGSPNEFQVIFCRDVLLDLTGELRRHALGVLVQSLSPLGVLVIGRAECLRPDPGHWGLRPLVDGQPVYRRMA